MRHLALATGLALALAGCSFIPTYERPQAPVPAAFPDAVPAAEAAPLPSWEHFLVDARQRRLVELALAANRDLRVAVLAVEQARAAYGVQRADRLPSVGAGVGATRGTSTTGGGSVSSVYSAGLTVSAFELDLFGRVRSLSEAAFARFLSTDEGRRAAQGALVAAVANADLALRADDELLQITERTLASRRDSLRLVRLRFEGGVAAEPELQAANSLVAAASANVLALQRQRSQDRNALVLLLGQDLPSDLPHPTPLAGVPLAALPAALSSTVLLQRPDVRQAEQQLVAANANIGAARAAFFPRVTLTGSIGTASTQLSGLFEHGAWSFTPQLLQPLFDAGRNRSGLDAANAARDAAVAQYERAIQIAFRETADVLAGRATLSEQLAAQQALADAETRRLALAELLYQGGVASSLDRLDAERSALAAQQAVVQLQLAQLQNQVLLYRVLGGGAGDSVTTQR